VCGQLPNPTPGFTPAYVLGDRVPKDSETLPPLTSYKRTRKQVKGATVYERPDKSLVHIDTFHKGKGAEIEVYDRQRPAHGHHLPALWSSAQRPAAGSSETQALKSTQDTMLTLTYQERLTFHSDTYRMRSANRPAQLLVNADYDRALLLDLARRSTKTIPFPPGVKDFAIYSWLVAPDGSASYLTSPEPGDFGLRLDHSQGTATRFHCPYESEPLTEFCWQEPPPLQIFDYAGQIRTFDSTRGIVYATADVLEQEPTRTYLKLRPEWTPIKAANYGHGVYVSGRQQTLIGYLPPPSSRQPALLAPQDASAIDVTHYLDSLFVCYEEKIVQYTGDTEKTVLEPPPEHYFIGINVLPVDNQPLLCVLRVMQDYTARPGSFIDLYQLAPEQQQTTG